ncbi:hypothetical protein [Desulfovibrio sp. SGI.169]|uniref:hypothetical protein n=1 Tax=Desulfovibrio sp. SGI.169 TaxID=3420561 RepID=UPI003CFE7131
MKHFSMRIILALLLAFSIPAHAEGLRYPGHRQGCEGGDIACNAPELHAHIQGKDAVSPTGRDISANAYLYLYKNNQPFASMRVYDDQCHIATKRIGNADWYSVRSRLNKSGQERSAMSLVSPNGLVLNIFDDSRVSVITIDNEKDCLFLQWTSEYEEEPGKRKEYSHDALVGKNFIRLRDVEGLETAFDWSELRAVTAKYEGGDIVDNTTCRLFFETRNGRRLTILALGGGWLDWLEGNRNNLLTITYGTCHYDREMDSGSGLFLYNAIPQDRGRQHREEGV